jgi:hypothetical protein
MYDKRFTSGSNLFLMAAISIVTGFTIQLLAVAQASNVPAKPPLKVGFIMVGPVADLGWNQAHNEGRLYLEKEMKGKVQTIFAENIPENAAQKIKDGKLAIFRGPLKDCYGKERVAAGKVMDDVDMSSMDWLVSGAECAFAKKN